MTREPSPKYKFGDVVRIVDVPYRECPFTWVNEMTERCSMEAMIEDVFWSERYKTHGYMLDIDGHCCIWCENCFSIDADLEESDSDITELFS